MLASSGAPFIRSEMDADGTETMLMGSPLRGHFTNPADRDSVAGLLGQYAEHLQWFEEAKLAQLRSCATFEECRERGVHLEINMNGAQLYSSPALYAESVMPRRFLEILKASGTDAGWSLGSDGSPQRAPHGTSSAEL